MKQIFVSSTFKDMHIERDLIQTKLSPDLNEDAYKKRVEGIQFQDLRWGIDADLEDEIENDKKIIEVCLDEIENNRPYFCVLLGDRYGWIPDNDLVKETGLRYGIYDIDEDVHKSITHLEVDYGFLRNPEFAQNSFAYIRNIKGDVTGTIYESNPFEKAKIEELKDEIRRVLPVENIHEYDVVYENGRLIGVEQFVELAKKDMTRIVLDSQLSEDNLTDNQKEIIYHKTQASEKNVISNARKSIEDKVIENIETENIITIKGESGNGKSTLMSKISKRFKGEKNSIILFSSLTPRTTTAAGMMRIITEYINENLNQGLDQLEIDLDQSLDDFIDEQENIASPNRAASTRSKEEKLYENALREYNANGKEDIIILIDAIDQLDNPRAVEALVKPINFKRKSKIKFIISYLDDKDKVNSYLFLNDYVNYKLGELSDEDRLEVIESSLAVNNKELPREIKEEVIKKEGAKSPLYIALLIQRLLMMNQEDYQNIIEAGDNYESITRYQTNLIKSLPNDLKDLIIELIEQAAKNLGTNVKDVHQTINYLGVSRRGLRELDLKKIYELQGKDYNSLDFATLKKYLRAFFLEDRYLRTDFTHKIIRHAILETINDEENRSYHNDIANAFLEMPVTDPIKLQEQYYSAYKAKNVNAALELLESVGKNASKLGNEDTSTAVESISKIHNIKLKKYDDPWISTILTGIGHMDLEVQKVLLAYFVYGSYEEKTVDSIKASSHNQELLLEYSSKLAEKYSYDYELISIYTDLLSFIGVKYISGSMQKLDKAEEYLSHAVNLSELIYDKESTDANKENLGNAYGSLARLYMELGPVAGEKARNYYEKSLMIFEEIADQNPNMVNLENLAMAYNNMANLYATGGDEDITLAKSYYFKTIEIIDQLLLEYNSVSLKKTLAMGHINIASLYFSEENYKQADDWYTKAIVTIKDIETHEPSLENKETLAKVYNNIADLYSSELIDDKKNAENFYKMAISTFESILRHKPILSARKNLSISYDNLGNLYADWQVDKAFYNYRKAIEIKENLLTDLATDEELVDIATSYNNLAFLYVDNRTELDLAIEYYNKAKDIIEDIQKDKIEKILGEDLAVIYTNLGAVYFILDDIEKSEYYYNKAIDLHKVLIDKFEDDDNIEKLLIIYENMAVNYADMDYSVEELERTYLKAIPLIELMKDPYKKVKKTAITYGNLANLYLMRGGDYKIIEDCYLKSAYLTQQVVDFHDSVENKERLAVIYYNLATLYELWGKHEKRIKAKAQADVITKEIGYENLEENLNKFIHWHDFTNR